MSSGMVKLPTPESAAEEIRSFYQKAGCPENPDGYEVSGVPETVEEFRDKGIEGVMKQIAYDQGVSKQAFENIVRGYYEKLATDMAKNKEEGEAALKEKWGEDKYDENLAIADRFFDTCSQPFCELVKRSGLANNAVFIEECFAKGKQTMADTLVRGEVAGDQTEEGYRPKFPDSPEMYRAMEGPEGEKARAYFIAKGHTY
jgi:translation initiation factor 2 beta subunit (eIF-2beta)/eIF-5